MWERERKGRNRGCNRTSEGTREREGVVIHIYIIYARESFQQDSKPLGIRARETNVFHDTETKRGSVEQEDDSDDDEEDGDDGDDSSPSFVKPFSCLNGREMETKRKKKARRAVRSQ